MKRLPIFLDELHETRVLAPTIKESKRLRTPKFTSSPFNQFGQLSDMFLSLTHCALTFYISMIPSAKRNLSSLLNAVPAELNHVNF